MGAWSFVLRGAKEGLTATDALKQYRAGGGHIANDTWYNAYNEALIVDRVGEQIAELPEYYTVNEYLATDSPFMWQQEWVMQMEIWGEDSETHEQYHRWVTVESDEPMTVGEYQNAAQDAVDYTPGSIPFNVQSVTDYIFYRRVSYE